MKRNLFIIDDYVDPQKDAIYQTLKNKKKDYLFLNAQPFCNDVFEARFYRQKLRRLIFVKYSCHCPITTHYLRRNSIL